MVDKSLRLHFTLDSVVCFSGIPVMPTAQVFSLSE
jgi:hypothetical protein